MIQAHRCGQSIRLSHLHNGRLRDELTAEAAASSRRVPCPAGSLLLWDSRTIHQGWAGGPRLAQPVCWEPRDRRERDADALRRKIFMCVAGIPSSHSSCEGRVHAMVLSKCKPIPAGWKGQTPAMRAEILPHGIAVDKKRQWEAIQPVLWGQGGDPRKNADCANIETLAPLLKPEVLAAL